jgi:hypothetical protein
MEEGSNMRNESQTRVICRRACLLVLLCTSLGIANAQSGRAEVESLLSVLDKLDCDFNRNGSWYTGAEAKAHLLRKYEHMASQVPTASADLFIEKAASASSFSGQPYLVRCSGKAISHSGPWLRAQLEAIRARAGKKQ